MTAHSELVARLEGAEVGSDALNRELWRALEPPKAMSFNVGGVPIPVSADDMARMSYPPRYTTSLQVAMELAARVCPAMSIGITYHQPVGSEPGVCDAWLYDSDDTTGSASAPTPALALCLAILRAKEPQPDGEKT